ncbi:MAG TPA: hypothetical protein VFH48_01660 [Chloroflexota bacterium]|nr:hypothetical protein [Chloroflexota bacterium]
MSSGISPSPRAGPAGDAERVPSLERGGVVDRTMASLWRSADTLIVRREHPRATRDGKVLPLHLARGTSARA